MLLNVNDINIIIDFINTLNPDESKLIMNFKENKKIIDFRKKHSISLRVLRRYIKAKNNE